jgi:hypothetical protein
LGRELSDYGAQVELFGNTVGVLRIDVLGRAKGLILKFMVDESKMWPSMTAFATD